MNRYRTRPDRVASRRTISFLFSRIGVIFEAGAVQARAVDLSMAADIRVAETGREQIQEVRNAQS
jgi:hypothetical protein